MIFYVLTLFPELFDIFMNTSIIKKGIDKSIFSIVIKNIREFALNTYGQVDDAPYGGGPGMLLRPEPIFKSIASLNLDENQKKVIYLSPKGKKIDHNYILNLTKWQNIVLICGHYEGVDQRVIDTLVDDEISLGDFVLTGGEIPALAVIDAVGRQLDGVIKKESLKDESFTNHLLEHRQYTRPSEYNGLTVPDVLLSGSHKDIAEWKLEDSVRETMIKRMDLIDNYPFDQKIEEIINKIKEENQNEHG